MDFFEISKNRVRGHKPLAKFGRILSSTGGVFEDISPVGGSRVYAPAALPVRIKAGGNVADILTTGTGAWGVFVAGVDANHLPISEEIITKGATVSEITANSYFRVDRAYVTGVGTNEDNVGAVTIENTSAVVMNTIAAGEGQTQICAFTVEAGYTAYVIGVALSLIDTQGAGTIQHLAHFRIRGREFVEGAYHAWRTRYDEGLDTDGTSAISHPLLIAERFTEKSDVKMEVFTHAAAAQADARMYVVQVRN
jgi:hypothetical protein